MWGEPSEIAGPLFSCFIRKIPLLSLGHSSGDDHDRYRRCRPFALGCFSDFSALGADRLRRPDCPLGLLSRGVCDPAAVAQRAQLCGSGGPVPVFAGAGQQSGGDRHRPVTLRLCRCPGGVGGLYAALGAGADPVCPGAGPLRRCGARRCAAWLEGGGRGGRRPSGLGHGAHPLSGCPTHQPHGGGNGSGLAAAIGVGAAHRHRAVGHAWPVAI